MSVHDDLIRRIDELDRTVAAMKTSFWRRPGWVALLACGLLGGWFGRSLIEPAAALAQPNNAQDLVVRSLKITDDKGFPRVVLSYDNFGGIFRVLSPDGKTLVTAEGDKDGGFISVNGLDGLSRVFLAVDSQDRSGLITLRAPNVKLASAVLGVDQKGGFVWLYNLQTAQRVVSLGNDESDAGGAICTYDRGGNLRGDLRTTKFGGAVNLIGSRNGKSHAFLGTGSSELGGMLFLRDTEGRSRAEIGQGSAGGYMILNGNLGNQQHISMGTSDNQRGGYMQIHNNAGKVKLGLAIDDAGNGAIDK